MMDQLLYVLVLAAIFHSLKFEQTPSTQSHDNPTSSFTSTVLRGRQCERLVAHVAIFRVERRVRYHIVRGEETGLGAVGVLF